MGYVSGMLDRFVAAIHWLRALSAYRRKNYGTALYHVEEFARLDHRPCDYHTAFQAAVFILNHRSDDAAALLRKVSRGEMPLGYRVIDPAYGRAYAGYYLALIERTGEAARCWEQMQCLPVSSFARRYLGVVDPALLDQD